MEDVESKEECRCLAGVLAVRAVDGYYVWRGAKFRSAILSIDKDYRHLRS